MKVELANESVTQFKQYVFLRLSLLLKDRKKQDFGNKYFLFFVGNAKGSRNVILGAPFLKEQLNFTWETFLNKTSTSKEGDIEEELSSKSAALSLKDKVLDADKAAATSITMEPVAVPRSMLASSGAISEIKEPKVSALPEDYDYEDVDYKDLEWLGPERSSSASAVSSAPKSCFNVWVRKSLRRLKVFWNAWGRSGRLFLGASSQSIHFSERGSI